MKLKAAEVLQIVIIAKAIRADKLDGNEVSKALLAMLVDKYVDGEQEVRDIIKELVYDVDAGFLGELISKALKRFVRKDKADEDSKQSGDTETVE
jgi:hypothetical protein